MPFSVFIPLNMSICVRTFAHVSTACESARELHLFLLLCTCFSTCVDKPGIFPHLLNMRTSSSHDPSLVYISLNMCICVHTFAHVTCESAKEYCTFCCSCAHAPPPVLINLNFPKLQSMRTSSSPVSRLLYFPQSRPQSPLFFWSAPRTRTSGQIGFKVRKSRTSGYTAQNQQ